MALSDFSPLQGNVALILANAQELVSWIAIRQDGLEVKSENSILIPSVLFDLVLEHHAAIINLVALRMNGSAFALFRPQFEAFVRAAWLRFCATQQEMAVFLKKEDLPLNPKQMIHAIEKIYPDLSDVGLSGLQKNIWKAMHSYTHGGMHQIAQRINNDCIESNYEPDAVIEVLKSSGIFALMALLQIASLSGKSDLEDEVSVKLSRVE